MMAQLLPTNASPTVTILTASSMVGLISIALLL